MRTTKNTRTTKNVPPGSVVQIRFEDGIGYGIVLRRYDRSNISVGQFRSNRLSAVLAGATVTCRTRPIYKSQIMRVW